METPVSKTKWYQGLVSFAPWWWALNGVYLVYRSLDPEIGNRAFMGQIGMAMILFGVGMVFVASLIFCSTRLTFMQASSNWWMIVIPSVRQVIVYPRAWITTLIMAVVLVPLAWYRLAVPGIGPLHVYLWGIIVMLFILTVVFFKMSRRKLEVTIDIVIRSKQSD